jgi:hypothetical protein
MSVISTILEAKDPGLRLALSKSIRKISEK